MTTPRITQLALPSLPKGPLAMALCAVGTLVLSALMLMAVSYGQAIVFVNMPASLNHWVYLVPVAAFFLLPLPIALCCVLACTPTIIYVIVQTSPTLMLGQMLFSYLSLAIITLLLAIAASRTNQLLAPLVSTDEETGAQLERFLRPNLETEINRAEREGTGLLLVYLQYHHDNQKLIASAAQAKSCASAIADLLRPFDQYYRRHHHDFVIIMPHTNSKDALVTVKEMIHHMPDAIQNTILVGIVSLNVGDTQDSLIEHAQQALQHV